MLAALRVAAALLALAAAHAEQETEPQNSLICDDYHTAPRDLLDCRKSLAFGLECRDRGACGDSDCGDANVARRAGMTCSSFPWYNGGHPISPLKWDDELEKYRCLTIGGNAETGTYCDTWETIEESADEYEIGECSCREARNTTLDVAYCHEWECEQKEVKKCEPGEVGQPSNRFPERCCYSCNDYPASSCVCSYFPEQEFEYSEASCTQVDSRGFCPTWHQEEYDEHDYHFREYEDYTCTAIAANGRYCEKWSGDIDSEEEFEFTDCTCDTESVDGAFCMAWTCYEEGMDYFFPNLLWSLLVVILGTPIAVVPFVVAHEGDVDAAAGIGCLALIWTGGFCVLVVWLGGFGAILIFLCVLAGVLMIFGLCSGCLRCPSCTLQRRKRSEADLESSIAIAEEVSPKAEHKSGGRDIVITVQSLSGRSSTLRINDMSLGVDLKRRIAALDLFGAAAPAVKDLRLFVTVNGKREEVNSEMTLQEQSIRPGVKVQAVKKLS